MLNYLKMFFFSKTNITFDLDLKVVCCILNNSVLFLTIPKLEKKIVDLTIFKEFKLVLKM